MDAVFPILIVCVVIALILGGLLFAALHERKRREQLEKLAEELGLTFEREGNPSVFRQISGFGLFGQGHGKQMTNLIHGETDEVRIGLFDYRYTVGSGQHKTTHKQTIASLQSERLVCPSFTMRPEGLFDKIGGSLGMQDIDFESHPEFSKLFVLKGDEEQVRAFFNEELLSFFEKLGGISVEARPGALIFYRSRTRAKPDQFKELLTQAYQIFGIMVDRSA